MTTTAFEHPKIDWDAADLYQFERFLSHVNFVFDGPLAELGDRQRVGWLGTWIGKQGSKQTKEDWEIKQLNNKTWYPPFFMNVRYTIDLVKWNLKDNHTLCATNAR
ncbi:hypothetical protein ABVT39_003332 [Epinephelus coioides]